MRVLDDFVCGGVCVGEDVVSEVVEVFLVEYGNIECVCESMRCLNFFDVVFCC